jgi:uncharacterized membrane protein
MHVHDISVPGWVHVIACLIALLAGAWNLALPKGTATHRAVGRAYIWAMIVVNISVLAIYKFDITFAPFHAGPDTFGFFHWLAVAALVFVSIGWYAARHQDRAVWAYLHPLMMLLSYYDLIGGGINEMFLRVEPLHAIAVASAKSVARTGTHPVFFAQAPVIILTQNAAMAATLLLIIYFAARVALRRRKRRAPALA